MNRDDDLFGPEIKLKWRLVAAINHRVRDRGWQLQDVARMTAMATPVVDDILRGRVYHRSVFDLMAFLTCLGMSIAIEPYPIAIAVGAIHVDFGEVDD